MSGDHLTVHFSSDSGEWETPDWLFRRLEADFGTFELDAAANPENAKCPHFFAQGAPEIAGCLGDGLTSSWAGHGQVFVNPPYGRELHAWTRKMVEQAKAGVRIVALIPARTDTAWWHEDIVPHAAWVFLLRGRLRFTLNGEQQNPAPFPSAVALFTSGVGIGYEATILNEDYRDNTRTTQ